MDAEGMHFKATRPDISKGELMLGLFSTCNVLKALAFWRETKKMNSS